MRTDFQFGARQTAIGTALALALAFAAPDAFAAGGGGGGGGGGNDDDAGRQTKQDMTTCPKGQVWDTKAHKCLRMHSEVLPDAQLVEYAYALAKAERYDEALQTLDMLKDPNTARALNYRGYATRKLGRTDEGVGYYLKSVAIDPNYAQVREYLGEAYVLQGKLDMARAQLETIAKICGSKDCEEYEDLADAIAHPGGA